MTNNITNAPQTATFNQSMQNHGSYGIVSKIVTAVSNLFQTIGHWFIAAGSWSKERVIDLCPAQIAGILDQRRPVVSRILAIPANQRFAALQYAYKMDQNTIEQLSQLFENTDVSDYSLSKSLLRFVTPEMCCLDYRSLLDKIVTISNRRDAVLDTAKLLMAHNGDDSPGEKERLIRTIANIPVPERSSLIFYARQFVSEQRHGGMNQLVEAIYAIPPQKREAVVIQALTHPLLTTHIHKSEYYYVARLINAIATHTDQFITTDMSYPFMDAIQLTARRVPPFQREKVMRNVAQQITLRPNRTNVDDICSTIRAIHINQMQAIVTNPTLWNMIQGLPSHLWQSKNEIVEAILAIPVHERNEAMRGAVRLISLNKNDDDNMSIYMLCIIQSIASIQANERAGFTENTFNIMRSSYPYYESRIAEAIIAIPAQERAEIIRNAARLVYRPADLLMTGEEACSLIQLIKNVPTTHRDLVTDLALHVTTRSHLKPSYFIQAITAIPAQERADVIYYACQLITHPTTTDVVIEIIRNIQDLPTAELRANFVAQRRRDQGLQQVHVAAVPRPPARGIDVHAQGRDPRTRAAVERLYESQKSSTPTQLRQAAKQFTVYLRDCNMDQEKRKLAQHAFFGLGPRKSGELFGALISETEFSVVGLDISGADLIGHLWIFASNLSDSKEQANAKKGMIFALQDSYEDDGNRVCNQGKVQRLITAVVQGRLQGVNIDVEAGIQDVPVQKAVTMFFLSKPENGVDPKTITELQPLLEAGTLFCRDNPLVKQDEFIEKLRAYWDVTFK